MAAEAPGAAFLQRRLARAQALPPAERSPEVQAFITSVELGRQACELLPLQQSGEGGGETAQPALPLDDPATTRRVLRAVLTVVQADHLCPQLAVFEPNPEQHIRAYFTVLQQAADCGSFAVLASTLRNYLGAKRSGETVATQAQLVADTAALLRCPAFHAVLAHQLEQLAAEEPDGSLPLTKQQLESAWHRLSILTAMQLAALDSVDPATGMFDTDGVQRAAAAAKAAFRIASAKWLQLEPDSLTAICTTADVNAFMTAGQWTTADLQRLLHATQLAQQRGSVYWAYRCAVTALSIALTMPLHSNTAALLRGVLDSFSKLELEVHSCKAALPQSWVQALDSGRQFAATVVPLLHTLLAALEGGTSHSALAASFGAQAQQLQARLPDIVQLLNNESICSGCGQRAVGLRTCARCRAVRYCSAECQAGHWPQHKHECRPAQAP